MSLVNDMLRDLERRGTSAAERGSLAGMPAVDAARPAGGGLRRWWPLLLMLLAVLAALGWRLQHGSLLPAPASAPPAAARPVAPAPVAVQEKAPLPVAAAAPAPAAVPAAAPVAAPAPQLLAVLPQHDESRFVLQLLFDRPVSWRRSDFSGLVSLSLPALQISTDSPQQGNLERQGRSLLWRLQRSGAGSELLIAGLGDQLQVRDRLEQAGSQWQLWIEVPFAVADSEGFDLADLPVAGAEPLPGTAALLDAPVVAAVRPVTAPASVPVVPAAPRPAPATPAVTPARPAQASPPPRSAVPATAVRPHQRAPLDEARTALQAGDSRTAVQLLEALQAREPDNLAALRWLARSWLAAGQLQKLPEQVPGWLARHPQDSELRMLLGRAHLQLGDAAAAVRVLEQALPAAAQAPESHSLLAVAHQQLGHWNQSAALYRGLLASQPAQASWLLGLAIALEQLGQPQQAREHYRQAAQATGLDAAGQRYVQQRISALGGQP